MTIKYIDLPRVQDGLETIRGASPFDHCIIDNFFLPEVANKLEAEFIPYDSPKWFCYKNQIEHKKALNDWNAFPALTYAVLNELNSDRMLSILSDAVGKPLFFDPGLHGGGWHIHGTGGNLNPHLDYSIHPKLGLQRKLNIIIYLSSVLQPEHGGHLGLWEHDEVAKQPRKLTTEVEPRFNRAVIFDTTQKSWHGMSRMLDVPEGIYRKSLAVYYLCEPASDSDTRGRALFAPREEQKSDADVLELIRLRSDVATSTGVYVTDVDQKKIGA